MKLNKTTGLDAIPSEIIKTTVEIIPEYYVLEVMNSCIDEEDFSETWMTASVVLIQKPRKNEESPPRYSRPICLLG